jgi:hypothetical protein
MDTAGTCADCGNPYPYLQRAHIVAKHKGGTDDPSNIIRICPNCHHIRDRAERSEWVKKRWEAKTPEQRSEEARTRMENLTPEQRSARAQRISVSKTGTKHRAPSPGRGAGGARPISPEALERRNAAVRAAWAAKTPEERAAHAAKVSAGKRKTG